MSNHVTTKRPMMSDLKESGGIEADASMIFMLYRDDYYNRDETPQESSDMSELEVIVSKTKTAQQAQLSFSITKRPEVFYMTVLEMKEFLETYTETHTRAIHSFKSICTNGLGNREVACKRAYKPV
ncbi:DnaB-like helicase C-terminal domain-containing protein [Staphylococcus pseudintermedius]|uniref:DnaB-like helicase C-terminal domain-containing protein n=1 Tax=Staphylococcus pseudintermedius TaxID=283734 RepID=UPI001F54E1D6|nr:DnaB-like helicase C-terminal domain-containing protein [Staphylococcus pseudintermedius]